MGKTGLFLTIFILNMVFASVCKSQTGVYNKTFAAADSLIENFMQKYSIGAGEVAITKDGKLVYNRAFGFSNLAKTDTTKPYNLFRIMSLSTQYTAIAIMQLIQDTNLNLNITDKVFRKANSTSGILDQPYYQNAIRDGHIYNITIQQLLEHNAGWDRDSACDGYPSCDPIEFPLHVNSVMKQQRIADNTNPIGDTKYPVGDSTLIKFLLQKGLNHNPGITYAYSNIGYLILGKVIEKKTHTT